MKVLSSASCRVAIAVLASAQLARASDWYVDAVNGSNANSGASATSAWRTIRWALDHIPTIGAQAIHVAAGTYDTALGESFPFDMRPRVAVLGAGMASTHVVAPLTAPIFTLVSDYHAAGYSFPPTTRIADLHLVGGTSGISIASNWNSVDPTLSNLEIELCGSAGIYVSASSQFAGAAAPTVEYVDIHDCQIGFVAGDKTDVMVRDSSIHDNVTHGVETLGGWGATYPVFQRCRIEHNGGHGIYAYFYNYGHLDARFEDCCVSRNAQCGWNSLATVAGLGGNCRGTFVRSTIANNGTVGAVTNPFNLLDSVVLERSIVWGNADDIDGSVTATNCDVGEPVSGSGNIMSDPLFENATAGDFRLRFGSPCIDAAASAPPAGTLDLARHARDVDGDLNTSEVADLGAFEFRPLELVSTTQLGTWMKLELRGPQSSSSTLYWTRGALAANPVATGFGQLDLQPALAHVYRVVTVDPITPAIVQRTIPNSAFLVGQTFAFQALTDNPLAPAGKAYTNAVQFTVLP